MSSVTGVILSGGKSERMGTNKAFLEFEGKRLIDRAMATFRKLFREIIIVTNSPLDYLDQDCIIASDIIRYKGPMGGIYTGLFWASYDHVFVSACDMPFLNTSFIEYMIEYRDRYDIVVPGPSGGLQPLHAVYSKRCLPLVKKLMDKGDLKITGFYRSLKTFIIKEDAIKRYDPKGEMFLNINTVKDFEHISSR
ncbi:MAG TPA: molybdenum cofactor guanylyltransferase [Syntrophales bacterium]|nr:molybdenum cofactor guanylyltransferase [Syntrophales bacterium]